MAFWTKLFKRTTDDNYERGIRLFNEGRYAESAALLEDVISDSNGRGSPIAKLGAFYAAEAHAKIGIALFYEGNLDGAHRHFEMALAENSHYPDLYYYLGVVHHHHRAYDRAIESLEKAVELNSEYAEAICYLGIALHDAGYFERATESFGRALDIVRRSPNPLSRVLVDKLDSQSFGISVLSELKEIVLENTGYEALVRAGTNAYNSGDYDASVRNFSAAITRKPDYPDLHCKHGIALLESKRFSDAAVSFKRAIEINPNYAEGVYYSGVCQFYQHRYAESRGTLGRAITMSPRFADVHCQFGIACVALGEFRAARQALETAIGISPGYAKAHYLLGLTLQALGELDAASSALKQALEINPDLINAQMDAGLHAAALGDWTGATQRFHRVVDADVSSNERADALCSLGSACIDRGSFLDARGYLSRALESNPSYIEAKKKMALAFFLDGKLEEAESQLRSAIALHQDYADLHKGLGDVLMERGKLSAARECYAKGLAINPDYADAVFGTVIAMRREGFGIRADETLRKFLLRHPANIMARTLLTVEKIEMPDE